MFHRGSIHQPVVLCFIIYEFHVHSHRFEHPRGFIYEPRLKKRYRHGCRSQNMIYEGSIVMLDFIAPLVPQRVYCNHQKDGKVVTTLVGEVANWLENLLSFRL